MAAIRVLALLVLSIFRLLPMVGDELDEATREHVQQRVEHLMARMTWLLQELEQRSLEQRSQKPAFAWGGLVFAALQQWQFWAIAGVPVLLFRLCWWLWKRRRQPEISHEEESSSSSTELEEDESEEEDADDYQRCLLNSITKRIRLSVKSMAYRRQVVEELASDLLTVLQERLSNSFFPALQPAIGVGSAFEGWSPAGHDAVYHLLVPMKPPRGHTFHLELGAAGEMPAKNCVRVELECTCTRDQGMENVLCFLHQPEEGLGRNQVLSFLGILCTGSYLDIEKIARWFQKLVRSAWREMPQSRLYTMKVLPSSRSCKLQLTNASGRSLFIEMMFGVQRGDSDIFLSSQTAEAAFTPSTTWAETYDVAEAKFFRHVARQAPRDTSHLKCLQLCAGSLVGTGFSSDVLKTVVMHLLNTIPPSSWRRREFLMRLQDVMWYLHGCLEEKCLHHFFFGNENMPEDIVLPAAFQAAEPINLFQCLLQDPAAHAKALREFEEVQGRLTRLVFCGD
ncbi:inositol 1,4,5-trisphosphate receptor-interacting protein-like 1 [Chroicocephalus ridibundus]|uniref:inositol 1,4,5-trisphosphate receptor-interacting protein-like 1 n=1 Tax=Chroicocephalus ridibundus TaxID=1192867 RepID=UPI002FDEB190